MSRFYFGDSDESDSDSNLPFPKPLSRSSFLAPDFDPPAFLSSLANRHQTLADLRTELRDLSQSLNKELLDLVNENYTDFLSLGTALKGGEEKIEEVRVGLLGFQRDVKALRDKFETRTGEVRSALEEKKGLRAGIAVGHDLLDISECLDELEEKLMIATQEQHRSKEQRVGEQNIDDLYESETNETDEDEEEEGTADVTPTESPMVSLRRLEKHIQKYLYVRTLVSRVGENHPFIVNQKDRISGIKKALLLDLNTALKQAGAPENKKDERTSAIKRLYELMGEEGEAVEALKLLKI